MGLEPYGLTQHLACSRLDKDRRSDDAKASGTHDEVRWHGLPAGAVNASRLAHADDSAVH